MNLPEKKSFLRKTLPNLLEDIRNKTFDKNDLEGQEIENILSSHPT